MPEWKHDLTCFMYLSMIESEITSNMAQLIVEMFVITWSVYKLISSAHKIDDFFSTLLSSAQSFIKQVFSQFKLINFNICIPIG